MKRFLFGIICLFSIGISTAFIDGELNNNSTFTEDEYDLALAKSKLENKLVFIDFHATWCTPCKWMEQTTLADDRVKKILEDKYVTVKIDIDDFDGYDLKQQYAVQTLPTMIFLNSNGEMLERIDETIGAEKFLKLIKEQSVNVTPIEHPNNTSPFKKESDFATSNTKDTREKIEHSSSPIANKKSETNNSQNDVTVDETKAKRNLKKSYAKKYDDKNSGSIVKNFLSLQTGVFKTEMNAEQHKKDISEYSNLPIAIMESTINDEKVYKVFLGEFHSMDAAKRYKYKLKRKYKIKSLIK